jgi:hypothetical protein
VGAHIFYRLPGAGGYLAAKRGTGAFRQALIVETKAQAADVVPTRAARSPLRASWDTPRKALSRPGLRQLPYSHAGELWGQNEELAGASGGSNFAS